MAADRWFGIVSFGYLALGGVSSYGCPESDARGVM